MSLQEKLTTVLKDYVGVPLYVVDKRGFEITGNPHKLHDIEGSIILGDCFNRNSQELIPDILANVLKVRTSPPLLENVQYTLEECKEVVPNEV